MHNSGSVSDEDVQELSLAELEELLGDLSLLDDAEPDVQARSLAENEVRPGEIEELLDDAEPDASSKPSPRLAENLTVMREALRRFAPGQARERERELDRAIREKRKALQEPARQARKRDKAKLRQAKRRARLAVVDDTGLDDILAEFKIEPVTIPPEIVEAEAEALASWMAKPGNRQQAIRKAEAIVPGDIMATRIAYLIAREELAGGGSWSDLADRFSTSTGREWSREQARRRVQLFKRLEEAGGCWERDTGCAGLE